MFDKLLDLNIQTCSETELKALISHTLPTIHALAIEKLLNCCNSAAFQTGSSEYADKTLIAIKDGHRSKMISDINEDDFDLIIDQTKATVRFRKNPAKKSKLQYANIQGVGTHRLKIFTHMILRHNVLFSGENIGQEYIAGSRQTARNTFTKCICELCRIIGQRGAFGPYIVRQPDCQRKRSCGYKIDSRWSYLIVCGPR